jgi:hypothetical protein
MSKKLLLATILILLVGATFFGLGLSSVTENEQKTVVIAQQSRVSELKFTLPNNNTGIVTFNITGSYNLRNSTKLTILNQAGTIEYLEKIDSIPVNVNLKDNTEYIASFDEVNFTNSTILTASTQVTVTEKVNPFNYLLIYSAPIVAIGLLLFPFSIVFEINSMFKQQQKIKNELIGGIYAKAGIFVFYLFLLSLLTSVSLATFFGQPLLVVVFPFAITISLTILYVLAARRYSMVELKSNIVKTMEILKISQTIKYSYFGLFLVLVGTFIASFLTPYDFIYPIFFPAIVLAMMESFFSIFSEGLSPRGKIIIYLESFLDDYSKNGCSADFNSIRKASKILSELIKRYSFRLSPASISASLSYNIIEYGETSKISDIIRNVEQKNANIEQMLPLLETSAWHGEFLESKGIRALPSFFESYSNQITIIIALVTSLIALIQYVIR